MRTSLRRERRLIALSLSWALVMAPAFAQSFSVAEIGAGPRGDTANGEHEPGRLSSSGGRYLVFDSTAPDVVADAVDVNAGPDVFLYDQVGDTITLVTHAANDANRAVGGIAGAISADGRYVLYVGGSRDLVAGEVVRPPSNNVYLYDRTTNSSVLVSHEVGSLLTPAGNSDGFQLSADGRFVLYQSRAQTLVSGFVDFNGIGSPDLFLFDRDTGANVLVSGHEGSPTETANLGSEAVAISADGAWALFTSSANDIVAGLTDSNGGDDIYLYGRTSGTSVLVSRALGNPVQTANDVPLPGALSGDGRYVFYGTDATNVRAGVVDGNGQRDLFVFDRLDGQSTLVTHAPGSANTTQNGNARAKAISTDGRFVAFESSSTNIVAGVVDGNNQDDCWSTDLLTDTTILVSRSSAAANVTANGRCELRAVGADGRYLGVLTRATDVVAGVTDANGLDDVFLFDRVAGTSVLVSHAGGLPGVTSNNISNLNLGSISTDGAAVTWTTRATDFLSGIDDRNGADDVLVFDRASGTSALATRSRRASRIAMATAAFDLTPNGRWLTFISDSPLAGTIDANGATDAFLYDRDNRRHFLLSTQVGSTTAAANNVSFPGALTPDGNWVTLQSTATNLVAGVTDGNGSADAFLRDRGSGATTLVSHAAGSTTTTANGLSSPCAISDDHRYVVFLSYASNIVAGQSDANGNGDIFVQDRVAGTTTLVTHAAGSTTTTGNFGSNCAGGTPDGRWILYRSGATNLVPGFVDASNANYVFVYDRTSNSSTLVSHAAGTSTTSANGTADPIAISVDGRWIAFNSRGTNLVAGQADGNGADDAFLYDRVGDTTILLSRNATSAQATGAGQSLAVDMTADGSRVLLRTDATDLLAGVLDLNGRSDAYLYERSNGARTLVSHRFDASAATADCTSQPDAISADGSRVVFTSSASDVVDGIQAGFPYPGCDFLVGSDGRSVYVFDTVGGVATLVSHAYDDPLRTGNRYSVNGDEISADGSVLAFASKAGDLVTDMIDGNQTEDAFLASSGTMLFADDFEN